MTVLVLGASSQIGHFLLPRLLARGTRVLALSRRPHPPAPGLSWLRGQLPDAMPLLSALSAIVSCGPLPECVAWLADAPSIGAPRVVAVSSMSVVEKRGSEVPAERVLAERLAAAEAALGAACAGRGSVWTILRPTLLYGAGLDASLTPIARRAERWRVFPLPLARGLRQPLHAEDLAFALLAALETPGAAGRILPIGGGERLDFAAMLWRVRRSLAGTTLPLPIPRAFLALGGRLLPRWRGALSRLERDLVADNDEVGRVLGVHPRPFVPTRGMWHAAG